MNCHWCKQPIEEGKQKHTRIHGRTMIITHQDCGQDLAGQAQQIVGAFSEEQKAAIVIPRGEQIITASALRSRIDYYKKMQEQASVTKVVSVVDDEIKATLEKIGEIVFFRASSKDEPDRYEDKQKEEKLKNPVSFVDHINYIEHHGYPNPL